MWDYKLVLVVGYFSNMDFSNYFYGCPYWCFRMFYNAKEIIMGKALADVPCTRDVVK